MKAVRYGEYGGPDVLRVDEVDEPHAGPGQIRIAVRAVGVNPIDWKIRSGAMAQFIPVEFPRITASDVAGVVDEVGDGAAATLGDGVFGAALSGGAAEYAVLEHFAGKPPGLAYTEAAGLPVAVETAARCLDLLDLHDGQTIVVNGAAGGVGIAGVQLARARGLRVIGTASRGNHDFLRELGAEPTTYGDGLVERVRALAPDGVHAAFDTAGRGAIPGLVELTGDPQQVVTIADFTAPQYGARVSSGSDTLRAWRALAEVADLYEQQRFTMPIAGIFPFARAAEAHRQSEDGHVRGKLVLVPDGDD